MKLQESVLAAVEFCQIFSRHAGKEIPNIKNVFLNKEIFQRDYPQIWSQFEVAFDRAVVAIKKPVGYLAKKFKPMLMGVSVEDLEQELWLVAVKCLRTYKPESAKFISYFWRAAYRKKQELKYIRTANIGNVVHIPPCYWERFRRWLKYDTTGHSDRHELGTIAESLGFSNFEMFEISSLLSDDMQISRLNPNLVDEVDERFSIRDFQKQKFELHELYLWIVNSMKKILKPRHFHIWAQYHGIVLISYMKTQPHRITLWHVGNDNGITNERVRQIVQQCNARALEHCQQHGIDAFDDIAIGDSDHLECNLTRLKT